MLKDKPEDPRGGPHYNQWERVRVETLWKDRLNREQDSRRTALDSNGGFNGFQMNLANTNGSSGLLTLKYSHNRIETVTEKELKQSPQARSSLKGMDPDSFEVRSIKHLDRKPTDKFDIPMTEAHLSGWLLGNPVRADTHHPPQPRHARRSSSTGKLRGTQPRPRYPSANALTIASPANDLMLERCLSAPNLPNGPPMSDLKQLNSRKWYRPKRACDVTTYADTYQTALHHNPFNKAAAGR